jgi:hypothetical protein
MNFNAKNLTTKMQNKDYFENQMLKDFDLERFSNPEMENELDYLSENETMHRNESNNVFTLIRKAKKFEKHIRKMNLKLLVIRKVVHSNFEKFKKEAFGNINVDPIRPFELPPIKQKNLVEEVKMLGEGVNSSLKDKKSHRKSPPSVRLKKKIEVESLGISFQRPSSPTHHENTSREDKIDTSKSPKIAPSKNLENDETIQNRAKINF